MRVAYFWPKCDFDQYGLENGVPPEDVFFVGLTPYELKRHLPGEKPDESFLSPEEFMGMKTPKTGGRYWYLISASRDRVIRRDWMYPINSQWGGCCPMLPMSAEINNLAELEFLRRSSGEPLYFEETVGVMFRLTYSEGSRRQVMSRILGLLADDNITPLIATPSRPNEWVGIFRPEDAEKIRATLIDLGAGEVN